MLSAFMRRVTAIFAVTCSAALCAAQTFTYDDVEAGRFRPRRVDGLKSAADGIHYTAMTSKGIVMYSYADGLPTDTLMSFSAAGLSGVSSYELSADGKSILVGTDTKQLYRHSSVGRYLVYDTLAGSLTPISQSDSVRYAMLSPDGLRVAYVLDNDIYIYSIRDGGTVRVTADGEWNKVINGLPDWVYEEEFALSRAMEFSPDSRMLAFARTDESAVREFQMARYIPGQESGYTEIYSYKYPVAGERNSDVSLMLYDIADGTVRTVCDGTGKDQYIPYFSFTPDSRLYYFRMNRLQNLLEVTLADGDEQRVIYREESPTYIDEVSPSTLTFMEDSRRFVVLNETASGWYHLYMYDTDRGFLRAITQGEWEVESLVALTDTHAYYLSTEGSAHGNGFWSVDLTTLERRRMHDRPGTYTVSPAAGFRYYIMTFTDVSTPLVTTLHDASGSLVRTLEDNAAVREYMSSVDLPLREFISFTDSDGYTLDGYVIKPVGFDPSVRYPVLFTQYSGPGSREVTDSFGVSWEDVLAQNGYLIFCFDPRGTGGHGEAFKKLTYGKLGLLETSDQIEAARWVASLPYVDPDRIGIYGWSYGGYMALNCILKGADVFSAAVSVAPVTSWRYYDSIYTERYNGLPQDNPEGYDVPSPIGYAAGLKGRLLLCHGTGDDNVHVLNSQIMIDRLVSEDRQFELMMYTDDNHSMYPTGRRHIYRRLLEFCLRNL